jgi:hypothetical protein
LLTIYHLIFDPTAIAALEQYQAENWQPFVASHNMNEERLQ